MGGVIYIIKDKEERKKSESVYNYMSMYIYIVFNKIRCRTSDYALRHLLKDASDVASFASLGS